MPNHKKQPVPHVQAPRVYQRPEDLFRAEKDRSTSAARSLHAKLLAEAKAAFDKLMAEGQAARKSGRPRKHPLPPLKTGAALRAPGSFIRPSDVALGLVQLPVPIPPSKPAAPAKAKAKAKPKAKPKAKSKAKPKAKAKKKKK
ncbi:MAG TPA: hypothetical protein VF483_09495 [Gemmatimonadaceae bacterium]